MLKSHQSFQARQEPARGRFSNSMRTSIRYGDDTVNTINIYTKEQVDAKASSVLPSTTGASQGQVLGLDSNLQPTWMSVEDEPLSGTLRYTGGPIALGIEGTSVSKSYPYYANLITGTPSSPSFTRGDITFVNGDTAVTGLNTQIATTTLNRRIDFYQAPETLPFEFVGTGTGVIYIGSMPVYTAVENGYVSYTSGMNAFAIALKIEDGQITDYRMAKHTYPKDYSSAGDSYSIFVKATGEPHELYPYNTGGNYVFDSNTTYINKGNLDILFYGIPAPFDASKYTYDSTGNYSTYGYLGWMNVATHYSRSSPSDTYTIGSFGKGIGGLYQNPNGSSSTTSGYYYSSSALNGIKSDLEGIIRDDIAFIKDGTYIINVGYNGTLPTYVSNSNGYPYRTNRYNEFTITSSNNGQNISVSSRMTTTYPCNISSSGYYYVSYALKQD